MKRLHFKQESLDFADEIEVDLFSGGGGASTGIEAATERPVFVAVNHWELALRVHKANHPRTKHYPSNVFDVDPFLATRGRPVGLLWLSPDCFPAGTMVLTVEGYRPIEEVQIGDHVLTHQNRWRRVTDTMRSTRPLVRLRGHGHPGLLVSPEHPFYARPRHRSWNNQRRTYEHRLEEPAWTRAGDLEAGWYWASPTIFPPAEVPSVPVFKGRTTSITPALMWLAGRYIADGWTRLTESRAELVLTCGLHEVEGLRPILENWGRVGSRSASDEFAWHERATATAYQFTTSHRGFVTWLREHFGHGAAEKLIPGWALGMPDELRKALLDGYLSGDGCTVNTPGNQLVEATTVSKALAFGIKHLAATLGHAPAVYTGGNSSEIQGRKVNARNAWSVRWRTKVDPAHRQTYREGGFDWAPVREREDDVAHAAEVFNLSVEEDESYVVDGIVVHNCTHFSVAKGDVPRSQEIRGLADVGIVWAKAVRPRIIGLENVREFLSWGPLHPSDHPVEKLRGRPIKERAGEDFRRWKGELEALGYVVEWRVLTACDFGAPTSRKRLFLIARCDGRPIVWPEPTHGPGLLPYRTAAECIDWSIPCPSIFGRKRPLVDKTMTRVAKGIKRYVIDNPNPFIVLVNHGRDMDRSSSLYEPLSTVTASRRSHAIVAPTLVQTGYGERNGQRPRYLDIHAPLGTAVGGQKHALCAAFVSRYFGGKRPPVGRPLDEPLPTVTAWDHNAFAALSLAKFRGTSDSHPGSADPCEPLHTVSAGGTHVAQVLAFLRKHEAANDNIVWIDGDAYEITDIGLRMLQPHELLRAQFGRFADDYDLSAATTKGDQVCLIGNSAPPEVVEKLIRANYRSAPAERRAA